MYALKNKLLMVEVIVTVMIFSACFNPIAFVKWTRSLVDLYDRISVWLLTRARFLLVFDDTFTEIPKYLEDTDRSLWSARPTYQSAIWTIINLAKMKWNKNWSKSVSSIQVCSSFIRYAICRLLCKRNWTGIFIENIIQ